MTEFSGVIYCAICYLIWPAYIYFGLVTVDHSDPSAVVMGWVVSPISVPVAGIIFFLSFCSKQVIKVIYHVEECGNRYRNER